MSIIAMNTDNPLGRRPFQQMGLAGDFDFPGAPIPDRRLPPEMLAGNALKDAWIHPPATQVVEQPSPWEADEATMMLGDAAVTSTQTVVPTANTTPNVTSAVASGQPVWSAWFSQPSAIIPGVSNFDTLVGALALFAFFKAMK